MLRNYLTVGLRALAKNKTYAFINIFGLAIGMAACLTILLYVRYEMSYDAWMPGAERSYQFQDFYKATDNGGEEMPLQMTSYVSGKALVKDFPQIEKAVYVASSGAVIMQNGQPSLADDFNFVIIANLIAWPAAWWVMRDWLNGFDSRIALGPGPFVLAGGLALAIALGTIASHAIRVARANPIQALRYE